MSGWWLIGRTAGNGDGGGVGLRWRLEEEADGRGRGASASRRGSGGGGPYFVAAGGAAAAHPRPPPVQIRRSHGRDLHPVARALGAPLAGALLARPPPQDPRAPAADPRIPGAARPPAPRPALPDVPDRQGGPRARRRPPDSGLRRRLLRRRPPRGLRPRSPGLHFQAPPPAGDPHLTRLTVGSIRVGLSKPFSARCHTFSVLEVIYLEGVTLSDHTVENLVAACPLLRALDLRYCDGLDFVNVEAAGPHLRSLTVAECGGLPTNSHYYRAGSEPSESEEELLEENRPVEDLRGEAPPEEDGPEGELPEEEDELQEELPEGELSEEEVELQDELPEGELSEEEDELQDELPEGELSEEEDELQDELPEGEASEENQSEEDWSDEELSDGGQSEEDPVEDCLENLKLLKMTNFKGGDNEMRLLRFVLRNSTSLNQLLLFTSKSDRPEWLQKDHLDTSDILETKILPLQKALPNCQIILSESDGDAIQAFHREAFVNV
ncbi:hypothetical protein CFC21_077801 [Triticum aestivum]|uniref:FBD domain-containing protein n=2 Tax=Triticum aestivum TaxID=4565 RepID=A0A9R1HXG0_WHEAT|nr:hypothetical protein CFC21_077801 [Triticum aestivum]